MAARRGNRSISRSRPAYRHFIADRAHRRQLGEGPFVQYSATQSSQLSFRGGGFVRESRQGPRLARRRRESAFLLCTLPDYFVVSLPSCSLVQTETAVFGSTALSPSSMC